MIQLQNYFFEEESCSPSYNLNGETKRSLNGKAHTNRLGQEYKTFDVEILNLTETELGNIFHVISNLYPEVGNGEESVKFVDKDDNEYQVIIPLPIQDNLNISDFDGLYDVNLTLVETG